MPSQANTFHQAPINSGLGATTTTEDVIRGVDLRGKTAIVTGGYSGIGLESVRAFRGAGASVIVPARDHDKASRALAGLADVEIAAMDLLDPQSIAAFANGFVASDDSWIFS
jgi:NAD(P)-dependent dehydrogenase (short-subunit alcohol dehydrogenase family)